MPDQLPQMPNSPGPNATPEQRQVWAQQMLAWSRAVHPDPTPAERVGNWWDTYIGSPGSSKTTFDPSTGRPTGGAALNTPSLLNTNPTAKPTAQAQAVQNALGGARTKDIALPKDEPTAPSTPAPMWSQVGNLPPGTAQGQNGYQLPNMGFDKNANAFSDLPGYGTPQQGEPSLFDSSTGNFLGDSLYSDPADDSSGSGLAGFLKKLTGQDILGAAGLGLGATGMFMNASTQKDQFNQQMALEQAKFAQQQAMAGLNATQLNPYSQAQDAFRASRQAAIAKSGPAQAQLGSPEALDPARPAIGAAADNYLSSDALANAKSSFDAAAAKASGGGAQGNQALQNALLAGTNQAPAQVDDGGGFWHNLAKIGLMAAPLVAAPFTGGASLAAIGALSGAASGAMDGGGLKGALFGGALGAIPGFGTPGGLAEDAARPTLLTGLEQAGKKALTSPKVITSALSAALSHK